MDTLIFIRRTGFLFHNDIRMGRHKVPVIKRDMTYDTQPVGDNAKLEDIAEMSIDIQLPDLRIGRINSLADWFGNINKVKNICQRCVWQTPKSVCIIRR